MATEETSLNDLTDEELASSEALLDELLTRFAAPTTPPNLDALLETARRRRPREAWESLCAQGIVPLSWIDAPERAFALPRTHYARRRALHAFEGEQLETMQPPERGRRDYTLPSTVYKTTSFPTSSRWCALFAATLAARTTAEALAHQLAAMVSSLGTNLAKEAGANSHGRARVLWLPRSGRVRRHSPKLETAALAHCGSFYSSLRSLTLRVGTWGPSGPLRLRTFSTKLSARAKETTSTQRLPSPWSSVVQVVCAQREFAWYRSNYEALRSQATNEERLVLDRAAPSSPNPLDVLIELWRTGYVLIDSWENTLVLQ